ncbi:MAG: DUF4338 domain-containing protein [Pseudomonadota bacterium]
METPTTERFCGREDNTETLAEIREIVQICSGLSRTELANTVCELWDWKRPRGGLKTVECRQFLEDLQNRGLIVLPEGRSGRPPGVKTRVQRTESGGGQEVFSATVGELSPLKLGRVITKGQRDEWYELVDRYHYLGYQVPFGAQVRYFIESREGKRLGCLQFSSPAWKMACRDEWIGWNKEQRGRNLQRIINNSRFLILPWVRVKNLASAILALACRVVPGDWEQQYGIRPVLVETLVDTSRYRGTCYQAANWTHLGSTSGRGRQDREHARHGKAPKAIYVYPLTSRFREALLAR